MKIILQTKEDKKWYWDNQHLIPDCEIIIEPIILNNSRGEK